MKYVWNSLPLARANFEERQNFWVLMTVLWYSVREEMLLQNYLIIEYAFMYYWQKDIRIVRVSKRYFPNSFEWKMLIFSFFLSTLCRLSLCLINTSCVLRFLPQESPCWPPCRSCWEGSLLISSKTTRKSSWSFFQLIRHKNALSRGNWVYTQMAVAESLCWGRKWIFPFRLVEGFGDSFKVSVLAHNTTTATWS